MSSAGFERNQLRLKALESAKWSGLANLIRQVVQFGSALVLARFLSPAHFGQFAIVSVFVVLGQLLGSFGTAQVVIQRQIRDSEQLATIQVINVLFALFAATVLILLAPNIAAWYAVGEIKLALQLVALTFLPAAWVNVQRAILEQDLRFGQIATVEVAAVCAGSVVGITFAYMGFGLNALVGLALMSALTTFVGFCLLQPLVPLRYRHEHAMAVMRFSLELTGFNLVNYFARNADAMLIGKFIGAPGLGLYSLAYKILLYPLDNISRVVVRILFPALSLIQQDNERIRSGYVKVLSAISMVTFPLMLGLMALAGEVVSVLMGDSWIDVVPLLVIFAPIGMLQSIVSTVGAIHTAKGTTDVLLRTGLVNAGVILFGIVAGLPFGVVGVATGYATAVVVVTYPTLKLAWRTIDLRVRDGLLPLVPYANCAILMSVIVALAAWCLEELGASAVLRLFTLVPIGAALYSGTLFVLYRSSCLSTLSSLRAS